MQAPTFHPLAHLNFVLDLDAFFHRFIFTTLLQKREY